MNREVRDRGTRMRLMERTKKLIRPNSLISSTMENASKISNIQEDRGHIIQNM